MNVTGWSQERTRVTLMAAILVGILFAGCTSNEFKPNPAGTEASVPLNTKAATASSSSSSSTSTKAAIDTAPPDLLDSSLGFRNVTTTSAYAYWYVEDQSTVESWAEYAARVTDLGTEASGKTPMKTGNGAKEHLVTKLNPATKYHLMACAKDKAALKVCTTSISFTTTAQAASSTTPSGGAGRDTSPPFISAVVVNDVVPTAARISWTLSDADSRTISKIQYSADKPTFNKISSEKFGTGTVTLDLRDLVPETEYFWRVYAEDSLGNQAWSSPDVLETPPEPVTTAPTTPSGDPTTTTTTSTTTTPPGDPCTPQGGDSTFHVYSPAFSTGGTIPGEHAFADANISPPLCLMNVNSFATQVSVFMFDTHPIASGFDHWGFWNVPKPAGADHVYIPASADIQDMGGRECMNDFGFTGYGGPDPPPPDPHEYHIWAHQNDSAVSVANGGNCDVAHGEAETKMTSGEEETWGTYSAM